jgi:hypothetical protein
MNRMADRVGGRLVALEALVSMNLKQAVDEGGLRGTLLCQKFGNLELVYTAVTGSMPFVTNEKAAGHAIEDQHPPILVTGRRAAGATVKLSLDNSHVRSLACFPVSIWRRVADATIGSTAANFNLRHVPRQDCLTNGAYPSGQSGDLLWGTCCPQLPDYSDFPSDFALAHRSDEMKKLRICRAFLGRSERI